MKKTAFSFLPLLVLSLFCFAPALSQAATITSTVLELNGASTEGDGNNQLLSTTDPAELTEPGGYNFSADFSSLTSVMFIQVTLTLIDGNSSTDPDDFDYNHLFLALDGINTGLVLNGFRGGGLLDTLTFSGTVDSSTGAAIFASLQDGFLLGSIITDNANDTVLSPNELFTGNDDADATTTLSISDAVPEPTTVALIGRRPALTPCSPSTPLSQEPLGLPGVAMRKVGFCLLAVGAAICGLTQTQAQQTVTITRYSAAE